MSDLSDKDILNAIFNPLLPHGELIYNEDLTHVETPEEENSEALGHAKALELEGVKQAETGNLERALSLFSQAIFATPTRASGYNNRAQTLRLMGKPEDALADLNRAINLSGRKGRAACQAYCQRGLLHLRANRQEDAKADFEAAAQLGSQFAKAQLVQMNPYAALCNKMLKEVFTKLQNGETDISEDIVNENTENNNKNC